MIPSLAHAVTILSKDFSGYCSQELQKIGLTQGLLYFLLYIGKHPGCSPRALACALQMDTGHVTRSLAKLEQSGFIRQETNPADRRARILTLADKGTDAFRLSHELFTRWDDDILASLSTDEQAQLAALLQQLLFPKEAMPHVRSDLLTP